MLNKLLNHRLTSIKIFMRCLNTQPNINVGTEMKLLNDKKQYEKALELFDKYKQNDIKKLPSLIIAQALKSCVQLDDFERSKSIHDRISSRVNANSYILTPLIQLYMKHGDIKQAELLFEKSSKRTLPMYGVLMKGYIQNNMSDKAINIFNEITDPNEFIIAIFFNACAQLRSTEVLYIIKKVLLQIPAAFHLNSHVSTSLFDALMKCNDVEHAELLFKTSSKKTLPMYGAIMKGYIHNNMAQKAISIFNEIKNPDEIIFIIFFNACAQVANDDALHLIKKVLPQIPKTFYLNPQLTTSLLDALVKCHDIEHGQLLFDKPTNKTLFNCGIMMKGYIQNNMPQKAIELFNEILNPDEVVITLLFNACAELGNKDGLNVIKKVSSQMPTSFYSNQSLSNSLLDALIKCNDCSTAETVFSKMKRSVTSYGNLMNGFNKEDNHGKTLDLFNQMKNDDIEPDRAIYLSLIKALSKMGVFSLSQSILQQMPKSNLSDHKIPTALIDMWGKNGRVDEAKQIFENISQLNHIAYTAMINAYGLNGMGIQAIELFRRIPPEFISESTYVCVINACSHSGLVDEARLIFSNVQNKTEKIYTTMIDCFSRASMFEEAQKLIDEFEHHSSPSCPMYMALLSGARNEKNIQLSQKVFDRMKKLFPDSTNPLISAAVLLANTYASSGEVEKASDIRIQLNKSSVKRRVGLSWSSINGKFYRFRAHDQSHPRSAEIYAEADKMSEELLAHGHQYDSSWIIRPLNEDETISSVLCGHSEKLAIAWNFVENPNASQIQVSKNLRVCGDCHRATKLIAAIRQCEIIVRDANRIHHFYKNGRCSCNDYF